MFKACFGKSSNSSTTPGKGSKKYFFKLSLSKVQLEDLAENETPKYGRICIDSQVEKFPIQETTDEDSGVELVYSTFYGTPEHLAEKTCKVEILGKKHNSLGHVTIDLLVLSTCPKVWDLSMIPTGKIQMHLSFENITCVDVSISELDLKVKSKKLPWSNSGEFKPYSSHVMISSRLSGKDIDLDADRLVFLSKKNKKKSKTKSKKFERRTIGKIPKCLDESSSSSSNPDTKAESAESSSVAESDDSSTVQNTEPESEQEPIGENVSKDTSSHEEETTEPITNENDESETQVENETSEETSSSETVPTKDEPLNENTSESSDENEAQNVPEKEYSIAWETLPPWALNVSCKEMDEHPYLITWKLLEIPTRKKKSETSLGCCTWDLSEYVKKNYLGKGDDVISTENVQIGDDVTLSFKITVSNLPRYGNMITGTISENGIENGEKWCAGLIDCPGYKAYEPTAEEQNVANLLTGKPQESDHKLEEGDSLESTDEPETTETTGTEPLAENETSEASDTSSKTEGEIDELSIEAPTDEENENIESNE